MFYSMEIIGERTWTKFIELVFLLGHVFNGRIISSSFKKASATQFIVLKDILQAFSFQELIFLEEVLKNTAIEVCTKAFWHLAVNKNFFRNV